MCRPKKYATAAEAKAAKREQDRVSRANRNARLPKKRPYKRYKITTNPAEPPSIAHRACNHIAEQAIGAAGPAESRWSSNPPAPLPKPPSNPPLILYHFQSDLPLVLQQTTDPYHIRHDFQPPMSAANTSPAPAPESTHSTPAKPTTTSESSHPPPPSLLTLPLHHQRALDPYLPPSRDASASTTTPTPPPRLPHVTLTYATSLDSAISAGPGVRTILSGPASKAMTHYLRSRHASILVGVGTAETDDPKLNCMFSDDGREVVGEKRQPVPVVLDPSARWSCRPDLNVMEEFGGRRKRVMWISGSGREGTRDGRLEAKFGSLEAAEEKVDTRVECRYRSYDEGTRVGLDWEHFLTQLAELGIQSLMVEGGAKVIEDLLRAENRRFVSSVILTIAPVWLGKGGVTVLPSRKEGAADVGRLRDVKWLAMGDDGVMAGRFA